MTEPLGCLRPSEAEKNGWIRASAPARAIDHPAIDGRWIVFCSKRSVDAVWGRIRQSLESGDLMHVAASAAVLAGRGEDDHVICVYPRHTGSGHEVEDCLGVLRQLGIRGELRFKTGPFGSVTSERTALTRFSSRDFEEPTLL